MIIQDPMEMR